MNKSFSLQPIMNLAQHKNDSATRNLGQLNKQQQSAQQKLYTLLGYRNDYQARLQNASRSGMDQAELRNFQQFINKLDEAIRHQTKAVEQSRMSAQAGRNEFNITQRKLKSFGTLQQRHFKEQKKADNLSEQKDQDEHSGKLAPYQMNNSDDRYQ